jgi:hypothetical protein
MNRLCSIALLLFGNQIAFATSQFRDVITIGRKESVILERPLNSFLGTNGPRFDVESTGNYKGYFAKWEIKESRLYLTSFNAKTNGQSFPVSVLFPNKKLSIEALWYSGTIHVVEGAEKVVKGYLEMFGRLTAYEISKGAVVRTNTLRNVREDNLRK